MKQVEDFLATNPKGGKLPKPITKTHRQNSGDLFSKGGGLFVRGVHQGLVPVTPIFTV